ncbi:butyrophilin-like protein 2 isoform X1 [Monodelphis domestica]|uniref:butyrophilin-like protein 2 isoform X1 n=1 Tax=Monodelphis domestica TaxID=13616 RepID=UPI0024E1FAFF|nr:butyrophilin-like protein 2 isoform X1 [Monodelphis domestica]
MVDVTSWTVLTVSVAIVSLFGILIMRPSEKFTVTGSAEPILAKLNEDVILPCHLSPKMSAEHMEIVWFRSQFSDAVYVYRNGKAQDGEQAMEYKGRTELVKDTIAEGYVALRIRSVRLSDNGQYWCRFQENNEYGEARSEVIVTRLGTAPYIRMEGPVDKRIQFVCISKGWLPKPQAKWIYVEDDKRLFSKTDILVINGLFHVEMSLVIREDSSLGNVSCSVSNSLLHEEKVSSIYIPEKLDKEFAMRKVIGLTQSIITRVGEDVLLPCHLFPEMNAQNMEVGWIRSQFSDIVYMYRDGKDQEEEQMVKFKGRTVFIKDAITNGNVALKIRNIRVSDGGQYQCYFEKNQVFQRAVLEIQVQEQFTGSAVTESAEHIPIKLNEDTMLFCQLYPKINAEHVGVNWFQFHIPDTVYAYQDGEAQDGEQAMEHRGRTELMKDTVAEKSANLRIQGVRLPGNRQYWCHFQEDNGYGETKAEVIITVTKTRMSAAGLRLCVVLFICFMITKEYNLKKEKEDNENQPTYQIEYFERETSDFDQNRVIRESLDTEMESLYANRKSLTKERKSLAKERQSLDAERESLAKERQSLIKERESLIKERESLDTERRSLIKEAESLAKKRQCFTSKDEVVGKENELQVELQKEIERRKALYQEDWRKAHLYADWRKEQFQSVNVTMDPDTAHPELILSDQGRCVIRGECPQNICDNTKRFDSLPCVLGLEKITSGRHYWELKVGNRADWDLGVCRDDVRKKGVVTLSPENGFWGLRLYNDEYWALTSPPTFLSLRQSPHKIGIFLDYDAGDVSFYNMTDVSHIYNFTPGSFHGALCPFIRLWSCDQIPVSICPEP